MVQKILNFISLLGKPFRKFFSLVLKLFPKRKKKIMLEQSFYLFLIGIALLITVGFLGSVYSYMYNVQSAYEENIPQYTVE